LYKFEVFILTLKYLDNESVVSQLEPAIDLSNLREEFKDVMNHQRNISAPHRKPTTPTKGILIKNRRSSLFQPLGISHQMLEVNKRKMKSRAGGLETINSKFSESARINRISQRRGSQSRRSSRRGSRKSKFSRKSSRKSIDSEVRRRDAVRNSFMNYIA